ncbi:hypothetical protein OGATHE_000691 [Ogataea polymorpha]|uniref:Uncharacterized protein n=1 Tax=Ogataea polymorpha TaxID=460523 RepID=A0A9P8TH05_9ASCO|nr:hypothetical protein OGATHE_000691 [Ogataea polymorpha]
MSYRLSASGIGISISWSNRPGRLRLASMELILLVAPITTTAPSMLSKAIKRVAVTRVSTSETSSLLRLGVSESISSIKMIAGWYFMASLKYSRSFSSVPPRYFDTIAGPLILIT